MSIPRIGSVALFPASGRTCAGGAFELTADARETSVVALDDWEVEVCKGEDLIVARGGHEGNYDDGFRAALMTAQKGLDLLSIRGSNNLVIKGFDTDHIVWWPEDCGLVIRIVSLAQLAIDVSSVRVTARDADGNPVPPIEEVLPIWHESYRYFRLSQTTDDLFDAYRNAYLALESVLSSIASQKVNAKGHVCESEGAWFKRALNEAGKLVSLESSVPAETTDPVGYLYDEFYRQMRSAMSHAKSGRKVLLPRDEAERQRVSSSLQRLVIFYLQLVDTHLGIRRLGGGMTAAAFWMAYERILASMEVVVSDDESLFDKKQKLPNPSGGAVQELVPSGPAVAPEPFAATRLWSAHCSDLSHLNFVRRVVGVHDDRPGLVTLLSNRLTLGSSNRLEVVLGTQGSNSRRPRSRYSF